MAEQVQADLELMLTELEQMQRVGLLSPEETKQVIRRRKRFEYKLQKQTKSKEDILAYIQYECSLLDLIELRRDKIGYEHKKSEIDGSIAKRINRMFRIAEHRFGQTDAKIWTTHIAFLGRMTWRAQISKIVRRFLQIHCANEEAWIIGSRADIKFSGHFDNARAMLLEGLRFHPNSTKIFREYFMLELDLARRLRDEPDKVKTNLDNEKLQDVKAGKVVVAVFVKAAEDVDDDRFTSELLSLVNRTNLRHIFDSLVSAYLEKFADKLSAHVSVACLNLQQRPGDERSALRKLDDFSKVMDPALERFHNRNFLLAYLDILSSLNSTAASQPEVAAKLAYMTKKVVEKAKALEILPENDDLLAILA